MAHDLREILRLAQRRTAQPTGLILNSNTLESTPESGARCRYDGAKRRKGGKVHAAVDTLGHLLALHVTPANKQDCAKVGVLTAALQKATGQKVQRAFVDQGYIGQKALEQAKAKGIERQEVKLPQAEKWVCCLTRSLGCGAIVWLGNPPPPSGPRF